MNLIKKLVVPTVVGAAITASASPALAYTVKTGDTMSKIALDNEMSLQQLAAENTHITDLNRIYVGDSINISVSTVDSTVVTNNTNASTSTSTNVNTNNSSSTNINTDVSTDVNILARLVRAEAQSESYQGKLAVASVVMNRVASTQFPNTVEGVIYQSGQFSPVTNGEINKPADSESIQAAKAAINGTRNISSDTLFFYNPRIASSRWLDSKPTTAVIGNHIFKK